LLGPTNHHGYQPQLRRFTNSVSAGALYFTDFQRQIEIVSDPGVGRTMEGRSAQSNDIHYAAGGTAPNFQCRNRGGTAFSREISSSVISETDEAEIDGVTSRKLSDRGMRA
jgi:hypothetical protein